MMGLSTKIIILLVIGIFICMGSIGILMQRNERLKIDRDQAIAFNNARQDSIVYLTTKLGQESAKVTVLDLTNRNLRQMQDDERLAWIKQFEGVNKNMKNLEQAQRTTARLVANFKMPLRDTIIFDADSNRVQARTFDNHNEWFHLKGVVMADSVIATPEVTVPLESVLYWERKHKFLGLRFGRKQWFNETTSPNPYVKITKSEIIRVGRKK